MARAKRHYLPGQVWHITHRCHKRELLLKLKIDRKRWLHWLYEAKKRYGFVVLNYTVTSNHVHLLVFDERGRDVIPQSVKLIAARTGQGYNARKNRKGAFWEDRYQDFQTMITFENLITSWWLNRFAMILADKHGGVKV